jgi:hypothetical protein
MPWHNKSDSHHCTTSQLRDLTWYKSLRLQMDTIETTPFTELNRCHFKYLLFYLNRPTGNSVKLEPVGWGVFAKHGALQSWTLYILEQSLYYMETRARTKTLLWSNAKLGSHHSQSPTIGHLQCIGSRGLFAMPAVVTKRFMRITGMWSRYVTMIDSRIDTVTSSATAAVLLTHFTLFQIHKTLL